MERIYNDPSHWASVLPELIKMWRTCILPEVLGRWYTRKHDIAAPPPMSTPGRSIKDLKIEVGSCQRRLPEVILSLEKLVRMSEPVDNSVLDL